VVVLDRGRVVLRGAVDELKQSGAPRYRIETDADTAAALRALPGVRLLPPERGSCVTVEVTSEDDEQAILEAAQRAGRLRHFSRSLPSLSQLFAEAVARPGEVGLPHASRGHVEESRRSRASVGVRQ
jgi:ABC-2 type transport system ATP-binding protein